MVIPLLANEDLTLMLVHCKFKILASCQLNSLQVVEDLQANPEDNVPLFINVIVEALEVLGKVPEAVESLKCRIKREIALAIHRATDLVANRYTIWVVRASMAYVVHVIRFLFSVLLAYRFKHVLLSVFLVMLMDAFQCNKYSQRCRRGWAGGSKRPSCLSFRGAGGSKSVLSKWNSLLFER